MDSSKGGVKRSRKRIGKKLANLVEEPGGGREKESIASMSATYTLIHCRTVLIGNYEVIPKDRVLFSSAGVRVVVPSLSDDTKNVNIVMDIQGLRKVLVHSGRGMPVLFLYTNRTVAEHIQQSLGMSAHTGPYYDPSSPDDPQRRITLLPERISEESKMVLKNIFGNILVDLGNREANKLLVRASLKRFKT